MSRRLERVNGLLRQEISAIVSSDLSDPRLGSLVSVTEVDCSPDLGSAKVYVSVLGGQKEKSASLEALKSAAGFVHRNLRGRVRLRTVPSLEFRLDESIEAGFAILEKIRQTVTHPSPDDHSSQ
jgi:ribosome-binding factor A